MLISMYLAAIIAANLTITALGPVAAIPTAFVLIGLDLTTRDALHEQWRGRGLWWRMAVLIATGSLLSSLITADAGHIALASCVAFGLAGGADALTYHVLRDRAWLVKVNGSNIVAAAVDSLVFPTVAFGVLLPWIVIGQFVAKVLGGALWGVLLRRRAAHAEVTA